jgi:hypothetical protein
VATAARTPRTPPPVVTPQVTFGSGGPNVNFAPAFTLPGGFFLWGYTRDIDKPVGTPRYSSVRVKVHPPILAARYSAVKTALEGVLPGTQARFHRSGFSGVDGYARIDIVFGKAFDGTYKAGAAATAANVTAVLAAGAAAIP